MVGKKSGKPGKRYYIHATDISRPGARPTDRMYVPAAPIELVVLKALLKTLRAAPQLKSMLRASIERRQSGREEIAIIRAQVERDRATVERRFEFITANIDTYGEKRAAEMLREARAQFDYVERMLEQVAAQKILSEDDINHLVDRLIARMLETADWLVRAPRPALRDLLEIFIAKAVIDIDSRHLEVEFRVPSWLVDGPKDRSIEDVLACKTTAYASPSEWLPLLRFRIFWLGRDGVLYLGYGKPAEDDLGAADAA